MKILSSFSTRGKEGNPPVSITWLLSQEENYLVEHIEFPPRLGEIFEEVICYRPGESLPSFKEKVSMPLERLIFISPDREGMPFRPSNQTEDEILAYVRKAIGKLIS